MELPTPKHSQDLIPIPLVSTPKENFVSTPEENFESVAGLKEVKQFIKERMIEPLRDPELAQKYRIRVWGVLLYGPPGTGKTLIARATAGELDAEFIEISPSVVRGFPGEPEQHLEQLFASAMEKPRVVIFIDEADVLLAKREATQHSTVMRRVIPTLLSLFSKVNKLRAPVLIIAATNEPWNIDEAFLCPGRLDRALKVWLPDLETRVELLKLFLRGRPIEKALENDERLRELARMLDNWSGSDIEFLIEEVARCVYLEQRRRESDTRELLPITIEAISDGIQRGLAQRSVTDETLRRISEWEKSRQSHELR